MTNSEKQQSIESCIKKFTNIGAKIYFHEEPSSIMIIWKGNIPSEEATSKIENALRKYGKVVPNHFLDCNFVSFLIL